MQEMKKALIENHRVFDITAEQYQSLEEAQWVIIGKGLLKYALAMVSTATPSQMPRQERILVSGLAAIKSMVTLKATYKMFVGQRGINHGTFCSGVLVGGYGARDDARDAKRVTKIVDSILEHAKPAEPTPDEGSQPTPRV